MSTPCWKATLTWLAGLFGPVIAEWVPDMMAGRAPAVNVWHSLALLIVGAGLINLKRPSDHMNGKDK